MRFFLISDVLLRTLGYILVCCVNTYWYVLKQWLLNQLIVLSVYLLPTYVCVHSCRSDKSFKDNAQQFKGIELKWQSLI